MLPALHTSVCSPPRCTRTAVVLLSSVLTHSVDCQCAVRTATLCSTAPSHAGARGCQPKNGCMRHPGTIACSYMHAPSRLHGSPAVGAGAAVDIHQGRHRAAALQQRHRSTVNACSTAGLYAGSFSSRQPRRLCVLAELAAQLTLARYLGVRTAQRLRRGPGRHVPRIELL